MSASRASAAASRRRVPIPTRASTSCSSAPSACASRASPSTSCASSVGSIGSPPRASRGSATRGDDPEAIRHLNALCVRAYALPLRLARRAAGARGRCSSRALPTALARTWRAQALAWTAAPRRRAARRRARRARRRGALRPRALPPSATTTAASRRSSSRPRRASASSRARRLPPRRTRSSARACSPTTPRSDSSASRPASSPALPTCLLQLYNGLVLGAFASIFLRDPWPVPFLAWILPHAIPELTAITLCASAGLLLGLAVAAPGRAGRAAALRAALDPALLLFGAALPLFALAAAGRELRARVGPRHARRASPSRRSSLALARGRRSRPCAGWRAAARPTSPGSASSPLRPVADRQVAVQHRRRDRLGKQVEGVDAAAPERGEGALALAAADRRARCGAGGREARPRSGPPGSSSRVDRIAHRDEQHAVAAAEHRHGRRRGAPTRPRRSR